MKLDCAMYSKQKNLKGGYSWNKMWSLKFESRSSLHAAHFKQQPGSVLMFCPYYFRNG